MFQSKMADKINWEWNPTDKQRELFDEWKGYTINFLVSSREGCHVRAMSGYLNEYAGEDIPLIKMGFHSINQFLYAMQECIEVRTLKGSGISGSLFIFIRESAVPMHMMHIRELVMEQGRDKNCKTRTGVIKKPSRNQSNYVQAEKLLTAVRHNNSQSSYVTFRPVVVPVFLPRRPGAPINASRSRPTSNAGATYHHQKRTNNNVSWKPRSNNTRKPRTPSSQLSRSYPTSTSANKSFVQSCKASSITATTALTRTETAVAKLSTLEKENVPNSRTVSSTPSSQLPRSYPSSTSAIKSSVQSCKASSITATTALTRTETAVAKLRAFENEKENAPRTKSSTALLHNGWNMWTHDINNKMSPILAPPTTASASLSTSSSSANNLACQTRTSSSASIKVASPIVIESFVSEHASKYVVPKPLPKAPATSFTTTTTFTPEKTESKSTINDKAQTLLIKKTTSDMTPLVGFCLDTDDVLAQVVHFPVELESTVRNRLKFREVKVLPVLRKGSCVVNFSLKEYLTTLGG